MVRKGSGWLGVLVLLVIGVGILAAAWDKQREVATAADADTPANGEYVVLAWNDLGMHCYNNDFQDLAVLPPYNTLWAQVVKNGDPPQVVTEGLRVEYSFPDNSYSVGKSNFWDYDQALFGVDLPPNVGLTGKGMAGDMDVVTDHFEADGIPLTEFRDSDLNNPYPYQLAEIIVYDEGSGKELTRTTTVAPVSTEMHCDDCHYDGGVEDIPTIHEIRLLAPPPATGL